jgi:hypothetical protein
LWTSNCDGWINVHQLQQLLHSVFMIAVLVSQLANKKLQTVGATLNELAVAAAKEIMTAAGISEGDELDYEMVTELFDDFLKLACLL